MTFSLQALKGNVVYAKTPTQLAIHRNSYVIYGEGKVHSIVSELREDLGIDSIKDYGDRLVFPGFIDLHTHASQFLQRGIGLDKELIDWLKEYTFPGERAFEDRAVASRVYTDFINTLIRKGTTRASILATVHKDSTDLLCSIAAEKGLGALIGKVNMDQNCPEYLRENTEQSLNDTEELLYKYQEHPTVRAIITPRFVPTCSEKLLDGLGTLALKYQAPVQSHLSENRDEVKWVGELYPNHRYYSDVYRSFQLFGQTPTLMAHCIYLEEEELMLLRENHVTAVHCPQANMNLASGLMPIRQWQANSVPLALGSDVGAGHDLMMTRIMVQSIQNSKLVKAIHPESNVQPLSYIEALHLATKGNGQFLNSIEFYKQQGLQFGSLEPGFAMDALVIDDSNLGPLDISIEERLQRFIYIGDDRNITDRYIGGKLIALHA